MKLYHYMDRPAYAALIRCGTMVGEPDHSPYPDFAEAYRWLAGQMRDRICEPPPHAHRDWPVFSWHSHEGMEPVRYDIEHPEQDGDLLVGFDVPEGAYMLSDFDDFHFVLNGWYFPSTGSEGDDTATAESDHFDRICAEAGYDLWSPGDKGLDPAVEEMRMRHWSRIVDFPMSSGSVQATSWELRAEWMFLVRARRYSAIPGLSRPTRAMKRRRLRKAA
jgi:hypothetical protein